MSTSFPVASSFTTSLTHGGGVIGRRSCGYPSAQRFAGLLPFFLSFFPRKRLCMIASLTKQHAEMPSSHGSLRTLSPKPHMRARMGCCFTSKLQIRPSARQVIFGGAGMFCITIPLLLAPGGGGGGGGCASEEEEGARLRDGGCGGPCCCDGGGGSCCCWCGCGCCCW